VNALSALAVFVGAGLGGVGRYGLGLLLAQPVWLPFQIGTLIANLMGGFIAGALFSVLGPAWLKANPLGLFLMTGVLGGSPHSRLLLLKVLISFSTNPCWRWATPLFMSWVVWLHFCWPESCSVFSGNKKPPMALLMLFPR